MFKLYDDEGIIFSGTFDECLNILARWLDGEDLVEFNFTNPYDLYNNYEISREETAIATARVKKEFSSKLGFSIEPIAE